jgi:hypothetical protein
MVLTIRYYIRSTAFSQKDGNQANNASDILQFSRTEIVQTPDFTANRSYHPKGKWEGVPALCAS